MLKFLLKSHGGKYVYRLANMQRLFITQFNFLFNGGYRNKNGPFFWKLKKEYYKFPIYRWNRFVLSIHQDAFSFFKKWLITRQCSGITHQASTNSESQTVNILGFEVFEVTTLQLCCCSIKAALALHKLISMAIPKKPLFTKTSVGSDLVHES